MASCLSSRGGRALQTVPGIFCLVLLGLIVVQLCPATATADPTRVWWQLESSNCGAQAFDYGVGHQLKLEVPEVAPAGYYEFTLVMKISNDVAAATQGLTNYATNLWRGPDTSMLITNPTASAPFGDESTIGLLNPLNWTGPKAGQVNTPDLLMSNYRRGRGSNSETTLSASNGPQDFIRFTMRLNVPTIAPTEHHSVFQSVGPGLFASLPIAGDRSVYFGPNAGVPGATNVSTWAAASQTLPVIDICKIPEPATLAIFGVGLLMLVRRRG